MQEIVEIMHYFCSYFFYQVWSIYKDHKQVVRDKHSSEDHELQLTHFHGLLEKIQKLKLELKEVRRAVTTTIYICHFYYYNLLCLVFILRQLL